VDELERLGRHALERVQHVAVESLQRAWGALQPLIEQMFAQLEGVIFLLQLLLVWLLQLWLQIELQPAFNELGQHVAESAVWLVLVAYLILLGLGLFSSLLVVIIAVVVSRNSSRRP
jgi:hypothetical protein